VRKPSTVLVRSPGTSVGVVFGGGWGADGTYTGGLLKGEGRDPQHISCARLALGCPPNLGGSYDNA